MGGRVSQDPATALGSCKCWYLAGEYVVCGVHMRVVEIRPVRYAQKRSLVIDQSGDYWWYIDGKYVRDGVSGDPYVVRLRRVVAMAVPSCIGDLAPNTDGAIS